MSYPTRIYIYLYIFSNIFLDQCFLDLSIRINQRHGRPSPIKRPCKFDAPIHRLLRMTSAFVSPPTQPRPTPSSSHLHRPHHKLPSDNRRKQPLLNTFLRHIPLAITLVTATYILFTPHWRSISSEPLDDGYDLPHLLNITSLVNSSLTSPPHAANLFPHSLAARYMTFPSRCGIRPFRLHLQQLVSDARNIPTRLNELEYLRLVSLPDTLTVQICIGDATCGYGAYQPRIDANNSGIHVTLEDDQSDHLFLKRMRRFLTLGNYTSVLLVPSAGDGKTGLVRRSLAKLRGYAKENGIDLKVRRGRNGWHAADDRAFILHHASNLLVHRGGDAALSALMSTAPDGVLITEAFRPFLSIDAFRHAIKLRKEAIRIRPKMVAINGMGDITENCCTFSAYGVGDSAKILCKDAISASLFDEDHDEMKVDNERDVETRQKLAVIHGENDRKDGKKMEECWVLSIGCGGRWTFEEHIVQRTNCHVHVFDCTKEFAVPKHMQERVKFTELCVGVASDAAKKFVTWREMMVMGAIGVGLPVGTVPIMAKMDVEGWEFPVLTALASDSHPILPMQLLVEVHSNSQFPVGSPFVLHLNKHGSYGTDGAGMKTLFSNLSHVGYELVHRADNPYCGHCSEVTLLQRSALPALQ